MRMGRVKSLRSAAVVVAIVLLCGASVQVGSAQMNLSSLTSAQAGDGLKEALSRGITSAVSSTGRPGGYFDDAAIKILMPPPLQKVEKGLRAVGMGPRVDEFVKSMNSAAEAAAPAAKAIFMEALRSMTIEDAKGIVTGDQTAGTEYFKRTTSAKVADAFKPTIDQSMDKVGVTAKFQELMGNAPAIPFMKTPSVDINAYVLQKAVDGLFVVMGQEETKIRTNPAAQVTPLLKKVFGGR